MLARMLARTGLRGRSAASRRQAIGVTQKLAPTPIRVAPGVAIRGLIIDLLSRLTLLNLDGLRVECRPRVGAGMAPAPPAKSPNTGSSFLHKSSTHFCR